MGNTQDVTPPYLKNSSVTAGMLNITMMRFSVNFSCDDLRRCTRYVAKPNATSVPLIKTGAAEPALGKDENINEG